MLRRAGNASAYLERIVTERWREWTEALEVLRQAGWTSGEVLAAADALNGYWLSRSMPIAGSIALELHDAQEIHDLVSKWNLDRARYAARVAAVSASEELAWAVAIVAWEIWADNDECDHRVAALDKSP
jgi:hypothetical protein